MRKETEIVKRKGNKDVKLNGNEEERKKEEMKQVTELVKVRKCEKKKKLG